MSRLTLALGLALLALESAVALWLLLSGGNEALDDGWATFVLAFTPGVTFVLSGLIALMRRPENRTGVYLAAVGYLWLLNALNESTNEWLFTAGWLLGNLVWVPFTALVLAYPTGVLQTRLERAIPVVTGILLTASSFAVLLFDPTPAPDRCESCPGSAIVVADRPVLASAFDALTSIAGIVLIAVVVTVLVRRWRAASPALRRVLWPVLLTGSFTLVAIGLVVIFDQISALAAEAAQVLFFAAFGTVPLAFLLGILRTRLARSAVSEVVVALEGGTPLRAALAKALGDPSLDVVYRLDTGRWVDPSGRAVPDPSESTGRSVTMVERDGIPVAALLHDASLVHEPELVAAITAAAGLSLNNERLQAELRAQYAFLETITNTAPSLLVNLDVDGRIRNQNLAAVAAAGYDDAIDVRGRYFWEVFIDPPERDALIERFRAAAPEFAPAEYENRFVNARGEEVVVDWRSAPVTDQEGRVVSVIAGGLDITDRKRHEERLRAGEERLRAAIQGAPAAIVEVGLDDCVNMWNPAAEQIFGWTAAEVIGKPVPFVPPDREAEFRTLLGRIRAGHAYTGYETVRRRRDGRLVDVEISAAPIRDASGAVVAHMAVFSDISDRKRQDEELRASRARLVAAGDDARQRLERDLHDGAQQRLVALSVSLRLAESLLASDPSSAAELVAGARHELAQALDELRELARGIHPAVLTDRGLARAVESLVSRTPVPVEVDVPDRRLPVAIEVALYYVVAESLTNVAKYADASEARVRVAHDDGLVLVEVADDGAGGADPANGSGLRGLADRVSALDGTLVVESPAGGGTCVRAEIPVSNLPAPE